MARPKNAEKSPVLHNNQRNAYEEVEWLKMQLAVTDDEVKLMVWEKQCKDILK